MTTINPSAALNNADPRVAGNKGELTQDSFMKLLLTQLKMQNPLSPFDASTMMQQMSQLTGLSATQELAKSVEAMKANVGTSQVLEASGLVGKHVQVASSVLQLNDNEASGSIAVPKGVETITLSIMDASGKEVRSMQLNATSDGILDFSWNGLSNEGQMMPSGVYTVAAKGTVAGENVSLATAATVKVNSVALDRTNGIVVLNVDGLGGVSMNDVVKIL